MGTEENNTMPSILPYEPTRECIPPVERIPVAKVSLSNTQRGPERPLTCVSQALAAETYACPNCHKACALGGWSPYTREVRELECPSCGVTLTIEWDDDNGWYAWLTLGGDETAKWGGT